MPSRLHLTCSRAARTAVHGCTDRTRFQGWLLGANLVRSAVERTFCPAAECDCGVSPPVAFRIDISREELHQECLPAVRARTRLLKGDPDGLFVHREKAYP